MNKKIILRYINAFFPFLYPMKDFFNGNIFIGFFIYLKSIYQYRKSEENNPCGFPFIFASSYPCFLDRFYCAGDPPKHYFYQDLWGAKKLYESGIKYHYDIGSRLDGFIAHCLPFCKIVMLDIRPLNLEINNLQFLQIDCMDMSSIKDETIKSLSSFHAIEHFGLGRYGDKIDPAGHIRAINEMKRIVSVDGQILFGVPIGFQRLEFNAHRVFDPVEVINLFNGFHLVEFSVISDEDKFYENVSVDDFRSLTYGCGLFHFIKKKHYE